MGGFSLGRVWSLGTSLIADYPESRSMTPIFVRHRLSYPFYPLYPCEYRFVVREVFDPFFNRDEGDGRDGLLRDVPSTGCLFFA